MDTRAPAYNVDWVLSAASNVSATKDREWFTDYYPFTSTLNDTAGIPIQVNGIGTVSLPLKKTVNKAGTKDHVLHNVLHAPGLRCNIVCASHMLKTCAIPASFSLESVEQFSSRSSLPSKLKNALNGTIKDKQTGSAVGLLECPKLPKLRLKGQAPGKTSLTKDASCSVSVIWPQEEKDRWIASRPQNAGPEQSSDKDESHWETEEEEEEEPGERSNLSDLGNTADCHFSPEQLSWVKRHYGSTSKFFMIFKYSPSKPMDCAKARAHAQMFMDEEGEGYDSDNHLNDPTMKMLAGVMLRDEQRYKGKTKKFKKYPEISPINRMMVSQGTDELFSDSELAWIDKHYEDSWDFTITHDTGSPYNPRDRAKAKTLIAKLMKENP